MKRDPSFKHDMLYRDANDATYGYSQVGDAPGFYGNSDFQNMNDKRANGNAILLANSQINDMGEGGIGGNHALDAIQMSYDAGDRQYMDSLER